VFDAYAISIKIDCLVCVDIYQTFYTSCESN